MILGYLFSETFDNVHYFTFLCDNKSKKCMPQINSSCNKKLIDSINEIRSKESKTIAVSFSKMVEILLQEAVDNRKKKSK